MYINKKSSFLYRVSIFVLFLSFVFLVCRFSKVFAQTTPTVSGDAVAARQAQLQAQLDQITKQISDQQSLLDQTQTQSASIQRDISVLDTKIAQAKLVIQKENIIIQQLGQSIDQKTQVISTLSDQIDANQQSLAQIIKKTNQLDSISLAEIMLSDQTISDFFSDSDSFDVIKSSLSDVYQQTKSTRDETQVQKNLLDVKKNKEEDARQAIVTEQNNIQADEKQKQKLLALNKSQEKQYQQLIASNKKQADTIKAALFALRDSAAIPFGTALDYANVASQKTGVRPAFILAILTQESNLGENVGACYLRDYTTGNGVSVSTGGSKIRVMSPTRDVQPFLALTSTLGLNPQNMRVSCWMTAYYKGQPSGWGGAMGPSQFIPSTWKLYSPQLATLLNVATPNPWDPKAAIMATALYLENLGADTQTYSAERIAALKYYAGSNWNLKSNAFYGDGVMAKATSIQQNMIDPLASL